MTFRKEAKWERGFIIPKFYGIAWREDRAALAVCYPIPLNLIMRWWNNLMFKLKLPQTAEFDKFVSAVYDASYKKGERDCTKKAANIARRFSDPMIMVVGNLAEQIADKIESDLGVEQ